MEEWHKRLVQVLTGLQEPIDVSEILRLVNVPGDNFDLLFRTLASLASALHERGFFLEMEKKRCKNCRTISLFTGENVLECEHCGKLVPPPKFRIMPR